MSEQRQLLIKESLFNSIPFFFGLIIWLIITFRGLNEIEKLTMITEFKSFALIIWLIICLSLSSKMIPSMITVYLEENTNI